MLSDLYTKLKNTSAITALCGTRIYPHHIPQSATVFPILTFQIISNNHLHHLDGGAHQATARVQIDCWGRKVSDIDQLGEAVRVALQGFMGVFGSTTIHFVTLDNEQDLHEAPVDGSDDWIFRRSADYLIKYKE